jgi:orotidine-5'-phosphate decarboxylase
MGVIASAADQPRRMKEIAGRDLLVVTPGIRLPGDDTGDQKRVMTPRQAIIAGADYLVIGRPIVRALQAREAAARVLEDMNR